MYYTVIKHHGHLRTRGKCRKHEPQASVFYISRVFSNVRSVLSQCNTGLMLLHLLYDIEVMWRKTIKHAFSMFYLTNKEAYAVYYTVIKHDGHLRTRGKCRQHEPQASVFYISRVLPNVWSVLSQCNTRLRLLHLLYDIEVMWRKTIKHAFSMFYTLIKHGFLTNQSARTILSIL